MPAPTSPVDWGQYSDVAYPVLPKRQYSCWWLFHVEGLTFYAIALRLGISRRTVAYEMKRANARVEEAVAEAQTAEVEGEVRFGVTVEQAGSAKFKPDRVLILTDRRLKFALQAKPSLDNCTIPGVFL